MKITAILPLGMAALALAACSSESTNVTTTNEIVTDLNDFDTLDNGVDLNGLDNAANASDLGLVNNG